MIKSESIDLVREADLLRVITSFSDIELKKAGTSSFKGKSPFVEEKSASFFVSTAKGIYKCFSTGKGGNNPISFVMEKEKVEFLEAVKIVAEIEGIKLEYDNNQKPEDNTAKADIRSALEWACSHFCTRDVPESFSKYRAFPSEILDTFRIGYAPASWDDLLISAKNSGISTDSLLQAGLIRKREGKDGHYDFFRDRIMFPITDYRGNVVAFTGRDAESGSKDPESTQEAPPKYMNSPESCFDKSFHLYGLYQAIKGKKLVGGAYLVEGPTDVLRWHLHEYTNTVAPCGSAFTEQQAKLLKRFTDRLTIVGDNDCDKERNAGIEAMERNAMVAIKAGFTVKVLVPGIVK